MTEPTAEFMAGWYEGYKRRESELWDLVVAGRKAKRETEVRVAEIEEDVRRQMDAAMQAMTSYAGLSSIEPELCQHRFDFPHGHLCNQERNHVNHVYAGAGAHTFVPPAVVESVSPWPKLRIEDVAWLLYCLDKDYNPRTALNWFRKDTLGNPDSEIMRQYVDKAALLVTYFENFGQESGT